MKIKVYCEHGAFDKRLSELEKQGKIILYIFQYEEKNRRIKNIAIPSEANWEEVNHTFDELDYSFDQFTRSEKFDEITSIVGKENRKDILHLDSAYKSGCDYFITPDKKDIVNKRDRLEPLLNIKIFHQHEIDRLIEELN